MDDNQKKFLDELAQLFEKYGIINAYVTDNGFELVKQNEDITFQSYGNGAFHSVRTYESQYDPTKEE